MQFVWDWNGTLLDDIKESIHALNVVLESENLPVINDLDYYRQVFQFPVSIYYQKVGFDFNKTPFDVLAKRYMADYQPKAIDINLYDNAIKCLSYIKQLNIDQYLLSASDKKYLMKQLAPHHIENYFKAIYGLNHIKANSKASLACLLVKEQQINGDDLYFIGDSVHDYEVAKRVNAHCILIANGHEHKDKLSKCDCLLYDDLNSFYELFLQKL